MKVSIKTKFVKWIAHTVETWASQLPISVTEDDILTVRIVYPSLDKKYYDFKKKVRIPSWSKYQSIYPGGYTPVIEKGKYLVFGTNGLPIEVEKF